MSSVINPSFSESPETALVIEAMKFQDILTVQAIEKEIYESPWPSNAYHNELSQNKQAHYIVLRRAAEIIGYGGMWKLEREVHITTIGVRADSQSKGYGRTILTALVQRAYDLGSRWITLEVRRSNEAAISLYENFLFKTIGRRRGYYTNNGEDAIVMWSDNIHSLRFKRNFIVMRRRINIAGIGPEPSFNYPL